MPLAYAFKHVYRSWKLFLALLIGITLACAFFAGIDIKANATAKQALGQQLSTIAVDMKANIDTVNTTKMQQARNRILNIEGVKDAEIISSAWTQIEVPNQDWSHPARIIGTTDNSHVYDGWFNRPDEIGENETYIVNGSPLADKFSDGDVIHVDFSEQMYDESPISLNLTVKGLAQLDDKAYSIASGYTWMRTMTGTIEFRSGEGLLIVSWEKTVQKILDEAKKLTSRVGFIDTNLLIYLDRDALINAWDIDSSINNIRILKNQIENEGAPLGLGTVQNNLEWALTAFQYMSMGIRFIFTVVSLPIFFMAWYMGTTVSNVSFNLRRREIGLLLTKGFSRGQILRMFLTETVLIGVIGSILGVFLGFLLNPLFTQFNPDTLFNPQTISPYTMIFTVAFGIIMALFSTFSSANKASQLPTVDALREYLPLEEIKPYKKRWPWAAFILGTYKIIVFILGINMAMELTRIMWSGNFILILLVGIFMFIDMILNYIGPLLFFWGFTKLFIQYSLKFQELTAKAATFLGDLGILATKNVRRNPARSAAIAFLIALIVGYAVQVTGQLATEQDYAVRQVYYQVGADIAVYVNYASDAPNILNDIITNSSGNIQNATIEYSLSAYLPAGSGITVKAVEPQSWLKTSYYEGNWFSGKDVTTAFNNLVADKNTIILEQSVAKLLNLEVGEYITLRFGSLTKTLEVVGFFGPEPSEQQSVIVQQTFMRYWSFISEELYEEISSQVSASAKILLKLQSGVDGKDVAENIRNLDLNVSYVDSFAEEWEEAQTDVMVIGMLDVQRLGIVFAVLAASVGTALVSTVSMKERSREATIMSVKGLSYKQLIMMFLTENLALVIFSITLGFVVGLIVVYGYISSVNASIASLVQHRLVFPLDTTLMLFSCIALIFISTILPIIIMSRKYVTKLERMVRLR
jgi:ABC-type antimicrobial peptide transport system permease subunit